MNRQLVMRRARREFNLSRNIACPGSSPDDLRRNRVGLTTSGNMLTISLPTLCDPDAECCSRTPSSYSR